MYFMYPLILYISLSSALRPFGTLLQVDPLSVFMLGHLVWTIDINLSVLSLMLQASQKMLDIFSCFERLSPGNYWQSFGDNA